MEKDPGDQYPSHRDDFFWKSGTQWLKAKVGKKPPLSV
jgi:hypothetical protein